MRFWDELLDFIHTVKPPNSGHPMNSGQNVKSQM